MGKAKLYGMTANRNPKEWRGLRDPKKYRPRPREIKTTGPVAGREVKEKEAASLLTGENYAGADLSTVAFMDDRTESGLLEDDLE